MNNNNNNNNNNKHHFSSSRPPKGTSLAKTASYQPLSMVIGSSSLTRTASKEYKKKQRVALNEKLTERHLAIKL